MSVFVTIARGKLKKIEFGIFRKWHQSEIEDELVLNLCLIDSFDVIRFTTIPCFKGET